MENPRKSLHNSILEEAEFVLEDKKFILESPKSAKKQLNRGQSKLLEKSRRREYKCVHCSFLFTSKSIMLNHVNVCSSKFKKIEKQPVVTKNLELEANNFINIDQFFLDLLCSASSTSDLIKAVYNEYISRNLIMQTESSK